MKFSSDSHEKLNAVYELLQGPSISYDTFHHVHTLVKGLHPTIDKKLEVCAKALDVLEKLQSGDVVTLSAEHLPETTEKQKKRKKALLFFITNIKNLQSEIKRVDAELSQANGSGTNTAWHLGRILKYAKGPYGIVTLIALVIVGVMLFTQKQPVHINTVKPTVVPSGAAIQVITYNNKQIPLNQLFVGHGPDCDSPHYHAIGETTVTTLDGTVLKDPGGCGFGKVKDVQVTTVQQ